MWLKLLQSKSDAAEAIKEEAESGKKLRVLRTDPGGEFTSNTSGRTAMSWAYNNT